MNQPESDRREPNAESMFDFLDEEPSDVPRRRAGPDGKVERKRPIIRKPVPVSESGALRAPSPHDEPADVDDDFGFLPPRSTRQAGVSGAREVSPSLAAGPDMDLGSADDTGAHGVRFTDTDRPGTRSIPDIDDGSSGRLRPVLFLFALTLLGAGGLVTAWPHLPIPGGAGSSTASTRSDDEVVPDDDEPVVVTSAGSLGARFRGEEARIDGLITSDRLDEASQALAGLDRAVYGYGNAEFSALEARIAVLRSGVVPADDAVAASEPDAAIEEAARVAAEQRVEALRLETERVAAAAAESARVAEVERLAELGRAAEAERLAEAERVAEAERLAEADRATEVERLAEAERAAEAERLAEAERAAEAERLAEAERAAEAERLAEAERAAEAERLAEAERVAEAERLAEAERAAEAERLAEAERAAEAERLAEAERVAEAERLAEAERVAEVERLAEAERQQALREEEESRRLAERVLAQRALDAAEREASEAEAASVRAEAREAARARAEDIDSRAADQRATTIAADRLATDRRIAEQREAVERARALDEEQGRLAVLESPAATPAPALRTLIDDDDMQAVYSRLRELQNAVESRDIVSVISLSDPPSGRVQQLLQIFANSESIGTRISNVSARPADDAVTGTLRIESIVRADGSRIEPPPELASVPLTSTRSGDGWSPLSW